MNATTDPADETEPEAPTSQPETPPAETEAAAPPVASVPHALPQQSAPVQTIELDRPAAAAPDADAIRAEAAEVAQVCSQASRLGVQIDAADAVKRGLKPEALRAQVLEDLAARGDAASILASAPAAAAAKDSPLVAAARKAATDAAR